jgi:hypothetical protein
MIVAMMWAAVAAVDHYDMNTAPDGSVRWWCVMIRDLAY